ncbi:hypothetical protein D9M72_304270 [compost metagenome]
MHEVHRAVGAAHRHRERLGAHGLGAAIDEVARGVGRVQRQVEHAEAPRGRHRVAPGHIVVEADHDDRDAEEGHARHVHLAGQREVRLVEAVGPAPVPVRIAEQHAAAALAGGRLTEGQHVAADAVRIAHGHLQPRGQRELVRRRGRQGRSGFRVRDLGDEMRVAACQPRGEHAAVDVLGADGAHPRRLRAGVHRTAAALRAGLQCAHMAVVALGETGDEFVEFGRLLALQRLDRIGARESLEEEVQVEVGGRAEGGARLRFGLGAEVQRALPTEGDEGIGQRAQRVLGLCLAVADAQASPGGGADVGNAVGGAADLDGGDGGGGVRGRIAPGPGGRGAQHGTGQGDDGHAAAPPGNAGGGRDVHGCRCFSGLELWQRGRLRPIADRGRSAAPRRARASPARRPPAPTA